MARSNSLLNIHPGFHLVMTLSEILLPSLLTAFVHDILYKNCRPGVHLHGKNDEALMQQFIGVV